MKHKLSFLFLLTHRFVCLCLGFSAVWYVYMLLIFCCFQTCSSGNIFSVIPWVSRIYVLMFAAKFESFQLFLLSIFLLFCYVFLLLLLQMQTFCIIKLVHSPWVISYMFIAFFLLIALWKFSIILMLKFLTPYFYRSSLTD